MLRWSVHLEGGPRRVNHAAVAVGHKVYSFGGYCSGEDYETLRQIDVHIFNTGGWWRFSQSASRQHLNKMKTRNLCTAELNILRLSIFALDKVATREDSRKRTCPGCAVHALWPHSCTPGRCYLPLGWPQRYSGGLQCALRL